MAIDYEQRIAELEQRLAASEARTERAEYQLAEALERQTALAEVLRVMSQSPTDYQPVLDTMAESAARVCGADALAMWLVVGEELHCAASVAITQYSAPNPRVGDRQTVAGGGYAAQAVRERRTLHVPDALAERTPEARWNTSRYAYRAFLSVPLLRQGRPIGAIVPGRAEAVPYTEQQIELLETFADQAVIAIENARLFHELQERNAELSEALDRQTAMADVLKIISTSPTDLQPVLDAIAAHAARLCETHDAVILRLAEDRLLGVARYGPIPATPLHQGDPPLTRGSLAGRAVLDRQTVHVPDVWAEPDEYPEAYVRSQYVGTRSSLCTPLLREGTPIGAILVRRTEVRPFTAQHIALLEAFADQAVIAIENTRLFAELQERNRALAEALEQQTATAEILRVISRSPTNVQPVLDAITASAVRLSGSTLAYLWRLDGDQMVLAATFGAVVHPVGTAWTLTPDAPPARAMLEARTIHIPDIAAVPDHEYHAHLKRHWATVGMQAGLLVPLMQQGSAVGVISVQRPTPTPFTAQQIALLETFADQAVIAIENARLFQELQQRNTELQEALERQTATAEILRVMSQSPTDAQPVFDAAVEAVARLCGADLVTLWQRHAESLRKVAGVGISRRVFPVGEEFTIDPGHPVHQVVLQGRTLHQPNLAAVVAETNSPWATFFAAERARGWRAVLYVPLRWQGGFIGVFGAASSQAESFSPAQVALVETFAAQVVIAIENARLFSELQERTQELARSVEELRALSEVGQAINSSLDLQTVLTTIAQRAVTLGGAASATIWTLTGPAAGFEIRASWGTAPAINRELEAQYRARLRPLFEWLPSLVNPLTQGQPVQVDYPTLPSPEHLSSAEIEVARAWVASTGSRVGLFVPMLHNGQLRGTIALRKTTPGEFPVEVVRLLQTFASQSALAIQNAELYQQIEQQRRELADVSRHKSEFLANMSHELRTPLNGILGFSEILLNPEMPVDDETRQQFLQNIYQSGSHLLTLINDILDLSKVEAGKMELHPEDFDLADSLRGVHSVVKALADRKQQMLSLNSPADAVILHHDPGRFKQVLFNLLSNAVKFTPDGGSVATSARRDGEWVEVAVKDTGIGIAPEDQGKVFEEFQQIDSGYARTQQGTGLGLALVRSFVRLMGGDITLRSAVGEGSTFTVRLPVRQLEPATVAE